MAKTKNIVVNENHSLTSTADPEMGQHSALVSWVIERVVEWEEHRDQNYKKRWDEYYRLWKGVWKDSDKVRKTERSKLISPALQQAIESTVAEVEEATFGKQRWFDLTEDEPEQQEQANKAKVVNELLEEFDTNDVADSISEVILNAAIYGTGIAKLVVTERQIHTPIQDAKTGELSTTSNLEVGVKLVPIEPLQFVIDSLATSVDEALGCAHITYISKHIIEKKIRDGIYRDIDIGGAKDDLDMSNKGENKPHNTAMYTKIVEYHGLVPKSLLDEAGTVDDEDSDLLDNQSGSSDNDGIGEEELVEAIITIANDAFLLRAIPNPNFMKDRNVVSFQFEKVPNRFWGRGVAEKGYSPQKALDAELRARIDALAFALNPMMAINVNNIPRDLVEGFSAYPGKSILTAGPIQDSIGPIAFSPPPNQSFTQSGDLERMIEMGTGAVQASSPLGQNPRNSTASGIGIAQSGFIKRSKRVLRNIERRFLTPIIKKSFWRYMQADPKRFPLQDVNFRIHNTLGIIARELEQQQIAGMMQTVPPESPAFWLLMKAMYENSSLSNKEEMLEVVNEMLKQSMAPPKPGVKEMAEADKVMLMKQKQEDEKVGTYAKAALDLAKAEELGDKSVLGEFEIINGIRRESQNGAEGQNQTGGNSPSR